MRNVTVNPITQGSTDVIYYNFDFALDGTPTTAACTLLDMTTQAPTSNLVGVAIINGTVVTTPGVAALAAGKKYRLICSATISGNTMSAYVDIVCDY